MTSPLRLLIASADPRFAEHIRTCFAGGHQVMGVAADARTMNTLSRDLTPDVIVSDDRLPGSDEGVPVGCQNGAHPAPVILIGQGRDAEPTDWAGHPVFCYLVEPVGPKDLYPAARLAVIRFAELEALHLESEVLRTALHDRKLIERAKGIIMREANLCEDEAFRRLQAMARASSRKLVEIAMSILTAEEACHPTGH
jgi:response regulator NasT